MPPDKSHPFPRPLTQREAETLAFMLSPQDPRLGPLRGQAEAATVTGMCECGCATAYLEVDRSRAQPATGLRSPAIESSSVEGSDPRKIFWLILFLEDGWLSSLEIAYVDGMPSEFPPQDVFGLPSIGE